jgi:hypothetical protein
MNVVYVLKDIIRLEEFAKNVLMDALNAQIIIHVIIVLVDISLIMMVNVI